MKKLLFLMAALSVYSCSNRQDQAEENTERNGLSEKDRMTIVSDAKQMLNRYFEDIKKDGLMAEFKYLDDSPEFFWVPPGYSTSISYDSIAVILTSSSGKYNSIDNHWVELTVVPLTPDLASYTGKVHSRIVFNSGEETATDLMETGVLVKRADGWKLLSGQTAVVSE